MRVLEANPLRALMDVDQAVLVAIDQRAQQDAAHDAEDRGVGANAQGQRQRDGQCDPLRPDKGAQRKLEVGQEAHDSPKADDRSPPTLSYSSRSPRLDFDINPEKSADPRESERPGGA